MTQPTHHQHDFDDDEASELAALTEAVAASLADPRPSIPHSGVRAWLLEVNAGNFEGEFNGGAICTRPEGERS